MKKTFLTLAVVGCIGFLSSCKKDYVCNCSVKVEESLAGGGSSTTIETEYEESHTFKVKKKESEEKCKDFEVNKTEDISEGNATGTRVTATSCKLL